MLKTKQSKIDLRIESDLKNYSKKSLIPMGIQCLRIYVI